MTDLTLNEYRGFSDAVIKEILSKEKGMFSSGYSTEIKTPVKKIKRLEKIILKLQGFKFINRWKIILSGTR